MNPPPVEILAKEAESFLEIAEEEDIKDSDYQECMDEVWVLYSQIIDASKTMPVSTETLADAHYMKGVIGFEHGWLDEAKEDFVRSVELEQDGTSGYFHLGSVNLHLGDIEEAKRNLEKGFDCHEEAPVRIDEYVGACLNMARVFSEEGNTVKTIEWINKFKTKNPNLDNEHLLATRGGIYLKLGLVDEALKDLDAAVDSGLSHFNKHEKAKTYFDLGIACSQKLNYGQALLYMEQAVEHDPNDPNILTNYGVLLLNNGMIIEGIDKILLGLISHEQIGMASDSEKANLYNILSSAYMKQERFEEAEEALWTVLELMPDFPGIHYEFTKFHLSQGDEAAALESLKRNFLLDEEAKFNDTSQSALLSNLATAYQDLNEFDKMIEVYSRALKLNPENPQALAGRGILHEEQGNFKQAEEDITAALESDKDVAYALFIGGRVHHSLGTAKWKNGNLRDGEAEIKKALSFKGDDAIPHEYLPLVYNDLGLIRSENNNVDGAAGAFIDSLSAGATVRAYLGLGNCYIIIGETVDAEDAFRDGIELFEEFPEEYLSSPESKQVWLDVIDVETNLHMLDDSTRIWYRHVALAKRYVTNDEIRDKNSDMKH